MLKNAHKSDRQNNRKWNIFKAQRNKSTSLRRLDIRDYFVSRCKPCASNKDFFDAVGPLMTNKINHNKT